MERDEDEVKWSEDDIPPQFREDGYPSPEGKKRCPTCSNEIPEEAIRCLFCGRHIQVASGVLGSLTQKPWRIVLIIATLLALASVLSWVF